MSTQSLNDDNKAPLTGRALVNQALKDLAELKWLGPIAALVPRRSGEFGRQIETSLNQLAATRQVMKLRLRKSDKAVVMGVDQYQAILDMKDHYEALVAQVQAMELSQAGDKYDRLFQRIASPASRAAADQLFELSDDQLNQGFKGTADR